MKYDRKLRPVFELLDQIIEKGRKEKDPVKRDQCMNAVRIMIDQIKENQRGTL